MSARARCLIALVAAQVGVVAVGLWIHQRYALQGASQGAREQVWSELAEVATRLAADLPPGAGTERRGNHTGSLAEWIAAAREEHQLGVTLFDAAWRPLAGSRDRDSGDADGITWKPRADRATPSGDDPTPGTLDTSDGLHLGIAAPLPEGRGYLVIHRPARQAVVTLSGMGRSLMMAGIVTFIWTAALLGIVAWFLVSRMYAELSSGRMEARVDELRRSHTLVRTREAVIFGLAKLADSRDADTGDHLDRISRYSTALAMVLRRQAKYQHVVTPAFVRLLELSAALHDIGKIGVRDAILLKEGPLTLGERGTMQTHAEIGGDCLKEIEQRLGASNFLQMARQIASCHHERWDGKGYPAGLAGTAIPLAARIVAVADVYDALASRRPYKEPFPHSRCVELIREEAGAAFDPELVEVFLEIEPQFEAVACRIGGGMT